MALDFVAGPFSATYDGSALGTTEEGFETEYQQIAKLITTDEFKGTQDAVYQGINMQISTILMNPKEIGVEKLIWPWSTIVGHSGVSGRLWTELARPLVLTACKANHYITSRTYPRVILGTDPVTFREGTTEEKKFPVTLIVLPIPSSVVSDEIVPAENQNAVTCVGAHFYTEVRI